MKVEEFVKREQEIQEAVSIFPDLEVGEAYRKYKEAKGEEATMLDTADPELEKAKAIVLRVMHRPCTQPDCPGQQLLEGVCEGCVEGKHGYRSKWTCEVCLHRDLSKKPYFEWIQELMKEGD